MGTLYENIMSLCESHGIKGGKMCTDLGISKGLLTDLKMGRRSGVSAATAQKIANYFGVTVGHLLGEENEKTPTLTKKDERKTEDDIVKFALFKGDGEVTDAMLDEVKAFAAFVQQREKQKKETK